MSMNLIGTSILIALCTAQVACGGMDDVQGAQDAEYDVLSAGESAGLNDPAAMESTEHSYAPEESNSEAAPEADTYEIESIPGLTAIESSQLSDPETTSDLLSPHCTGYGGCWACWCLAKCSHTGNTLHVVGTEAGVGGYGACVTAAEAWCIATKLGHRTFHCWGKP